MSRSHEKNFSSKVRNLQELFKFYRYVLPVYQRDFSWGTEQIDDLFSDIDGADDSQLMIGQIVTSYNRKMTSEFEEDGIFSETQEEDKRMRYVEVIDGQQRLTSLSLVLLALAEKEWGNQWKEHNEVTKQKNFISWFLLNEKSGTKLFERFRLDTSKNQTVWEIILCEEIMADKKDKMKKFRRGDATDGDTKLWQVYEYIAKKLDEAENAKIDRYQRFLFNSNKDDKYENCITANVLHANTLEDGHVLFDTINTRGQRLNAGDLIKSYIYTVMKNEEQDTDSIQGVMDLWNDLEKKFKQNEVFVEFLHAWLLANYGETHDSYERQILNNQNKIYQCFKGLFKSVSDDSEKKISIIICKLIYSADIYKALCDDDLINNNLSDDNIKIKGTKKYTESIKSDIGQLKRIGVKATRWFLLGIMFLMSDMAKRTKKKIATDEVFNLSTRGNKTALITKMTLMFNLRYAISKVNFNAARPVYLKILKELRAHISGVNTDYKEEAVNIVFNNFSADKMDIDFETNFKGSAELTNRLGKVVIQEIENAYQLSNSSNTIRFNEKKDTKLTYELEHIFPVKPKSSVYIASLEGIPGDKRDEKYREALDNCRSIGNMVVIEQKKNNAAKNSPFMIKKAEKAYGDYANGTHTTALHTISQLFADTAYVDKKTHLKDDFDKLSQRYFDLFEKHLSLSKIKDEFHL